MQDSKKFAEERHDRIMEILMQETSIEVSALARILKVTDATIRRDLTYLESKEKLYRTHGGAIYREEPIFWQTTTLEHRAKEHPEEKKKIARHVASIVNDHDSLMIDGGSTNTAVAEELARTRKHLMVVTNSQHIGEIIMNGIGENQAIIIGGELMYQTQNTVGPIAVNMINDFRLDKAIISTTSIIPDQGCFSANPQEGEIKKQMMLHANKVYVVVDSSKIGKFSLYLFSDLKDVTVVITDAKIRKTRPGNLSSESDRRTASLLGSRNTGGGDMVHHEIGLGLGNNTDFELVWDPKVLEKCIKEYDIHKKDLNEEKKPIFNERDLLVNVLRFIIAGTDGECILEHTETALQFSSRFDYAITIGGTCPRSAIAMSKIGYTSCMHLVTMNEHIRKLLPPDCSYVCSNNEDSFDIHLIIQYPAYADVSANDIHIQTTRANRIIIDDALQQQHHESFRRFF